MRFIAIFTALCFSCSTSHAAEKQVVLSNSEYVYEFNTDVNAMSAMFLVDWLKEKDGHDVVIVIDSPGGSVGAGFEIIKAIEKHQGEVICKVEGPGIAASMAAALLQSCDKRIMSKRSLLLLHEPSSGAGGKPGEIKEQAETLEVFSRMLAEQYCLKSKWTAEELLEKMRGHDLWLGYKEAIELGFADSFE
jgi:ATP-dependent protease ClpP protease subunit